MNNYYVIGIKLCAEDTKWRHRLPFSKELTAKSRKRMSAKKMILKAHMKIFLEIARQCGSVGWNIIL